MIAVFGIINSGWISNILIHGNISGPCVWVSDYVAMGGNESDLDYDETLGCHVDNRSTS